MNTEQAERDKAARAMLAALKLLLSYELGGEPPLTMPRGLAIDHARLAIAQAKAAGIEGDDK